MTRIKRNMGCLTALIIMVFTVVILNLNTSPQRFSRLDEKTLGSFIASCDRLIESELPKGMDFADIPVERAQFTSEILRFRPVTVGVTHDRVWVMFCGEKGVCIGGRFSVIWERVQSSQMEWKLTLSNGTRSWVLLRRTNSPATAPTSRK